MERHPSLVFSSSLQGWIFLGGSASCSPMLPPVAAPGGVVGISGISSTSCASSFVSLLSLKGIHLRCIGPCRSSWVENHRLLFASALPFFPSDRVFAWSPEWVCQGDREGMGWKRKDLMRWRWDVMMVMTRILKIVIIRTTFIMHLPLIRIASLNRVTSCGLLRVLHFFTLRGKNTSLSVKLKWCPERWGLDLSGFFSMEKEEKMKK